MGSLVERLSEVVCKSILFQNESRNLYEETSHSSRFRTKLWGVLLTRVLYIFSCHERQAGSRSGHTYDLDVTQDYYNDVFQNIPNTTGGKIIDVF